jgi:hypothetical protein
MRGRGNERVSVEMSEGLGFRRVMRERHDVGGGRSTRCVTP